MAQKPFVLPSGVDFYAGDGSASGNADPLFRVDDANNRIGINTQNPTGTLDITVASTGDRGVIIRTNTSQGTNIFEVLNPSGNTVVSIDSTGSYSGINAVYSSGIRLISGIPSVSTNNNLYASGSTLYWNGFAVSGGPIGPAGPGGASGNYGSFYDITTQTAASTTGAYPITIGQVAEARNVVINNSNQLTFNAPGTYSINYTAQLFNGSSQTQNAQIWLRKNGSNLSNSNSVFTMPAIKNQTSGAVVAACNYVYTVNSGDYFQLYWNVDSTSVVIATVPTGSNPPIPQSPSVIVTAQQVMYTANAATLTFGSGLSGSTSGSYNGSGNVTANLGGTGTLNQLTINPVSAGNKALLLQGAVSQTANLFEIQSSSGTPLTVFDSSGRMSQNIAGNSTNIAIGANALNTFNGTWNFVTAIGYGAASNMGSVGINTAIGYNAMAGTVGNNNTAIGVNAMANTSGSLNYSVAIGESAMQNASAGSNTAIGVNALKNVAGLYNIGIGAGAGSSITTGGGNIIIGSNAGLNITTTNYSVLIGQNAGQSTTSTMTAVGYNALQYATAAGNTAFGNFAGQSVTVGSNNTIIGDNTYLYAPSGSNNVVVGQAALPNAYNTISNSVIIGQNAMNTATNSSNHVIIGRQAGYSITTGGNNTLLGYSAGYTITTGAGNTLIGTSVDVVTNSISGSIAIGSGAQANQNNQLVIGSLNTKVGKSDGTGEQSVSLTAPSGITKLLETRINGSIYNIPLLPSGSTNFAATVVTPPVITSTGALTLTDSHNGYIIEQTGVSGTGIFTLGSTSQITIPGWNCMIVNIGSGARVASGTNTMRSPGGLSGTRTQYSSISIYRRGAGDFVLAGDLA